MRVTTICVVLSLALVCLAAYEEFTSDKLTLVDSDTGDYGTISVLDHKEKRLRIMRAENSIIGGEWLGYGSIQPMHTVFEIMAFVRYAIPIESVLQLGLGVGSVPMLLQQIAERGEIKPLKRIDVVEIDEIVATYAQQYFSFNIKTPEGTTHVQDGKEFLFSDYAKDLRYDVIVHDVFSDGPDTKHMGEKEVFERIKELLAPHGVFIYNVLSSDNEELSDRSKTGFCSLRDIFPKIRCFRDGAFEGPVEIYNMMCFCSLHDVVFDMPDRGEDLEPYTFEWLEVQFETWEIFNSDTTKKEICIDVPTELQGGEQISKLAWENAKSLITG